MLGFQFGMNSSSTTPPFSFATSSSSAPSPSPFSSTSPFGATQLSTNPIFVGYDWQSGKLDPSMMNAKQGLPHLVNVNINLDTNGNCQECTVNPLNEKWKKPTDFPVIHHEYAGSKNKYIYAATSSGTGRELPHFPFDTVVKLSNIDNSVQKWSVGTRRFIGEPIFVPKGDEEDYGYLLVVEYAVATQRCYLVILDSKRIWEANAFVARLEVPKHLNFPLGFHGFWSPSNCTTGVNI